MSQLGLVNASTGNLNNLTNSLYGINTSPINTSAYDFSINPTRVANNGTWGIDLFGSSTPTTPTGTGANSMTWQQGLGYGLAGLQALTGLANAFIGYKNYKLAKKQFGFEKEVMNRNIANQAKIINNTYNNAAQVAAGMIGAKDSAGNYGMTSQDVVDRYAANAEKKHVDGSRVG